MHGYKAYGKILYCIRCADVQPLLLAAEYDEPTSPSEPFPRNGAPRGVVEEEEDAPESVEELEAMANRLRDAVGLRSSPEQLDLGVRHAVDDDALVDLSNRQTSPRVPVTEGFEGSQYDEDLPSPGL